MTTTTDLLNELAKDWDIQIGQDEGGEMRLRIQIRGGNCRTHVYMGPDLAALVARAHAGETADWVY